MTLEKIKAFRKIVQFSTTLFIHWRANVFRCLRCLSRQLRILLKVFDIQTRKNPKSDGKSNTFRMHNECKFNTWNISSNEAWASNEVCIICERRIRKKWKSQQCEKETKASSNTWQNMSDWWNEKEQAKWICFQWSHLPLGYGVSCFLATV